MKKAIFWTFISTVFFISAVLANDNHPLTFHTAYEQNVFETGKDNAFQLLLASDKQMDQAKEEEFKANLDKLLRKLDHKLSKARSLDTKVRRIFNFVHDNYLFKYDGYSKFSLLFEKGEYNCVTASALYAFILDHFEIEYSIRVLPTHVYLIADPGGKSILLETTDPQGGFFSVDNKFKHKYIEYLLNNGKITKDEFDTKSVEDLFGQHYFHNEAISLAELAGGQYYNEGVTALEEDEMMRALALFEKAYHLYPTEQTKFLIQYCIKAQVQNIDYTQSDELRLLFKLLEFNENESVKAEVEAAFSLISEQYMIKNHRPQQYEAYYNQFKESIKSKSLHKDIDRLYFYTRAQAAYLMFDYAKAMALCQKALKAQPKHLRVRHLLGESLTNYLYQKKDYQASAKLIKEYFNRFPYLKRNPNLQNFEVLSYLGLAASQFKEDKFKEGVAYLELFEKQYRKRSELEVPADFIANAYDQAAIYHIRSDNFDDAKVWLSRGMKYAPDNASLNKKLELINESKSD